MTKSKAILSSALGAGALLAAIDLGKNLSVKALPDLPETEEGSDLIHDLLFYFENPDQREKDGVVLNDEYIRSALYPAADYIGRRFDCQDFRMQSMLRLLYSHFDELKALSPAGADLLCGVFVDAKYWMTEPGEDSACYWSENHQLLYAVSEYLAGNFFANTVFSNDGAPGREHALRGKERIKIWMKHRFSYGYTEFNSSNYYLFDFAPAANFIQFAKPEDADMAMRMKMCLDLLVYDIASNMYRFSFIAPTARAYTDNMVGESGDRVRKLTDLLWGLNDEYRLSRHHQFLNIVSFLCARGENGEPFYEVPEVLLKIGRDEENRVICSSTGLDVSELPKKGFVGLSDEQIMMQFGMESFTNPEVIENTMDYLRETGMFSNRFLNLFKAFNIAVFRPKGVRRMISEKLNPMPNGVAIQRADLYGFRTPYGRLACTRRYHPGLYGAQQCLSLVNFGGQCVVFTTHPTRAKSEKTVNATPGYWAGFGRAPHIDQYENVQLQIFKIPKHSGFLEMYLVPQFTHTYLPEAFFDSVELCGHYAFAKKGGAFLALIGSGEFFYDAFDEPSAKAFKNGLEAFPQKRFDLIQRGNEQFVIYEVSDERTENFEEFKARIQKNKLRFENGSLLIYESESKEYRLSYGGEFFVNGGVQLVAHKRFESDYITAEGETKQFEFAFGGSDLKLNFEKGMREFDAAVSYEKERR